MCNIIYYDDWAEFFTTLNIHTFLLKRFLSFRNYLIENNEEQYRLEFGYCNINWQQSHFFILFIITVIYLVYTVIIIWRLEIDRKFTQTFKPIRPSLIIHNITYYNKKRDRNKIHARRDCCELVGLLSA